MQRDNDVTSTSPCQSDPQTFLNDTPHALHNVSASTHDFQIRWKVLMMSAPPSMFPLRMLFPKSAILPTIPLSKPNRDKLSMTRLLEMKTDRKRVGRIQTGIAT